MNYLIIKSIHIIFVVSYFAGLFYMIRLFIYQRETKSRPEIEQDILIPQYQLMQRRLWTIITVPAFLIMLTTGMLMLYLNPFLLETPWMHLKLSLIVLLIAYHFLTWRLLLKFQKGEYPLNSGKLRLINEAPTLLLFAVVFVVILKQSFFNYWYWVLISFVAIGVLIMLVVRFSKMKK